MLWSVGWSETCSKKTFPFQLMTKLQTFSSSQLTGGHGRLNCSVCSETLLSILLEVVVYYYNLEHITFDLV